MQYSHELEPVLPERPLDPPELTEWEEGLIEERISDRTEEILDSLKDHREALIDELLDSSIFYELIELRHDELSTGQLLHDLITEFAASQARGEF